MKIICLSIGVVVVCAILAVLYEKHRTHWTEFWQQYDD